jgi:uroporphyrin-III C-methyltransferase / precorrin-2 dehydrogenase / sirohydrochlorin ferrochelatase
MNPYPLGLLLTGRRVLVVGGGTVATRRIPALLDAGAVVVVVSPVLTPALQDLATKARLTWLPRRFEPSDVDGSWLVHVAVDDPDAAAQVSAAAELRQVFCVRADDRHAASAWTPATTRHGPVTVGVTAGGDHRRAMAIRDAIDALLTNPEHSGRGPRVPPPPTSDRPDGAGRVVLVGGGPGDPELITVKGRRLLTAADVVVVDRLAPGLLLDELRPEVELVDASKIPYGPARTQDEINRLLVRYAGEGKLVVRLKGGDPFVLGRGGEELLACLAAGIPVTVVPGVTSAFAVPAAAGIPVTHRGVAQDVTVVSGHLPPGHPESTVDWESIGRGRGTVCVLMGLKNLAAIARALIGHGRPEDTPAAVIQDGTTPTQRTVRATVATIADRAAAAGILTPAVVVIGPVVDVLPPEWSDRPESTSHTAIPRSPAPTIG